MDINQMFEELKVLDNPSRDMFSLLDLDNTLGTNSAFECFKSINNYDDSLLVGNESYTYGVHEIAGGTPPVQTGMRLDNVPYCPVYGIGQNDRGGLSYRANLGGLIEDIVDYLDLLECLSIMKENDDITLTIDSPGGYIHTGVSICTHMLLCKGHIRTLAAGLCASAGSLIWSAGTTCEVDNTALLMWHMSSHMDMGNSVAIESEAKLQIHFVRNVLLAASLKKGHITEQEVQDICNIPEHTVYISATDMRNRLNRTSTGETNE